MNRRDKKRQVYHSIWDPIELGKYLNEKHCIKLWLYLMRYATSISDIHDIPFETLKLPLRSIPDIKANFVLFTSKIDETLRSSRGDTTKIVIKLQDNHRIETVIMNHAHRNTVCLSSQIGCAMGCKFCATGSMGIIGDLTCGEIIEQFYYANSISKIRNVVFMGMGEPLNNYCNVLEALKFLTDTKRYNLSPRHITVSTVGIIKNIYKLTEDMPLVNLALSLHAPNQDIRLQIVPTATSYHIDKLMEAIDHYIASSKNNKKYKLKFTANNNNNNIANDNEGLCISNDYNCDNEVENQSSIGTSEKKSLLARRTSVMIEYILIKNVNDRPEHARELGELLVVNDRRYHVLLNLIPYNPTDTCEDFRPPSQEDIKKFNDVLINIPYNIHTRIRQEMGQDIAGACGQLVVKANKSKKELVDVEDISLTDTKNGRISKINSKMTKVGTPRVIPNHISGVINTVAFSVGLGFVTYMVYKFSRRNRM